MKKVEKNKLKNVPKAQTTQAVLVIAALSNPPRLVLVIQTHLVPIFRHYFVGKAYNVKEWL
jgi:hypothetical protein